MLPPASSQTSLDIRDVLIAKAHRIRALGPAPLARGRSTATVAFALGFFLGGGDLRLRAYDAFRATPVATLTVIDRLRVVPVANERAAADRTGLHRLLT
jgi:hypothetical protein